MLLHFIGRLWSRGAYIVSFFHRNESKLLFYAIIVFHLLRCWLTQSLLCEQRHPRVTATSVFCLFTGKSRTLSLWYFVSSILSFLPRNADTLFCWIIASGFVLETLASTVSRADKTRVGSLLVNLVYLLARVIGGLKHGLASFRRIIFCLSGIM